MMTNRVSSNMQPGDGATARGSVPERPVNFRRLPRSFSDMVDPSLTALVMWDMQKGLAGKAPNLATLRRAASTLVAAADHASVPVIWSQHVFPPLDQMTGPWLAWMMRRQSVKRPEDLQPMFQDGSEDVEFLDDLAPQKHHLVLRKGQPSLFVDTPFEHHLKVRGLRSIVLAGFATDIGIEFTARHAIAQGYHVVVAEDATGAYAQENHDRSITFLRDWAHVAPASRIVSEWSGDPGAAMP